MSVNCCLCGGGVALLFSAAYLCIFMHQAGSIHDALNVGVGALVLEREEERFG